MKLRCMHASAWKRNRYLETMTITALDLGGTVPVRARCAWPRHGVTWADPFFSCAGLLAGLGDSQRTPLIVFPRGHRVQYSRKNSSASGAVAPRIRVPGSDGGNCEPPRLSGSIFHLPRLVNRIKAAKRRKRVNVGPGVVMCRLSAVVIVDVKDGERVLHGPMILRQFLWKNCLQCLHRSQRWHRIRRGLTQRTSALRNEVA